MAHHGSLCPKRTSVWSNDPRVIAKLVAWPQSSSPFWSVQDLGKLSKEQREASEIQTTRQGLNLLKLAVLQFETGMKILKERFVSRDHASYGEVGGSLRTRLPANVA